MIGSVTNTPWFLVEPDTDPPNQLLRYARTAKDDVLDYLDLAKETWGRLRTLQRSHREFWRRTWRTGE